jgi:sugar/nucleoside kinase (ribokinase family)
VPTGTSFIIPSVSGDRTVLAFRGANTQLQVSEIPTEKIMQSDLVYITSLSGAASQLLVPITDLAKKHAIPVAVNPGGSQLAAGAAALRESLHNIDIVILNAHEANMLMMSLIQTCEPLRNKILTTAPTTQKELPQLLSAPVTFKDVCFDIRHFFQEVLSRGPRIVVVTNGAEGVYVATKECIYFHPSLPINVVSTIGAGDAFGSCFVASIVQGKTIEQAMLRGIINSGSVLGFLAAKTGLLTTQALEKKVAEAPQNLVQKFLC